MKKNLRSIFLLLLLLSTLPLFAGCQEKPDSDNSNNSDAIDAKRNENRAVSLKQYYAHLNVIDDYLRGLGEGYFQEGQQIPLESLVNPYYSGDIPDNVRAIREEQVPMTVSYAIYCLPNNLPQRHTLFVFTMYENATIVEIDPSRTYFYARVHTDLKENSANVPAGSYYHAVGNWYIVEPVR